VLKATGVVRAVDRLGRVVLPVALRRERGINPNDAIEICVEGENIVLQKYKPHCVFCGEIQHVIEFSGKLVCLPCAMDIGGSAHAAE